MIASPNANVRSLQLRSLFLGNYGLRRALFYTFIFKILIFVVGVILMGVFSTRTGLSSGSGGNFQMFGLDQWPHVEAYTDFRDLYMKDLVAPFLSGHDAYQLGTIVYNYPPLFLYLLSLFAEVNLAWFPAVPLVAFDILTVIPVYLISKRFLFQDSARIAFAVSLIWAANPINLFYNDLMWLNPGPTTFFLLMAVYYFLKKEWYFSAFMLAISTGFKQISVLALPIFLALLWKSRMSAKPLVDFRVDTGNGSELRSWAHSIGRAGRYLANRLLLGFTLLKPLLYYLATFVGFLVVISLPYLVTEPQNYFYSLQLPILGYPPGTSAGFPTTFSYPLSEPTRLTTFLGLLNFANFQGLALTSYRLLDYAFAFAYVGLIIYILLAKVEPSGKNMVILTMAAFLLFFTLYGRGIYKYYFATITPLALPFFGEKRQAIMFEVFSIALILVPRVVTPWMSLLLLTMLPRFLTRGTMKEQITPFESPAAETPSV